MAEIVHQYKNGVVSSDFTAQSLSDALKKLTKSDIETFKKNSGIAARELNSQSNAERIMNLLSHALR